MARSTTSPSPGRRALNRLAVQSVAQFRSGEARPSTSSTSGRRGRVRRHWTRGRHRRDRRSRRSTSRPTGPACCSQASGRPGTTAGTLFVLEVASGSATQLTPDGELRVRRRLLRERATLVARRLAGRLHVDRRVRQRPGMRPSVVSSTGGERVALSGAGAFVTSANWSPDGSLIAFDGTGVVRNGHDLSIVAPDGTGLTATSPSDFGPASAAHDGHPTASAPHRRTEATNEQTCCTSCPSTVGDPAGHDHPAFYTDYSWGRPPVASARSQS